MVTPNPTSTVGDKLPVSANRIMVIYVTEPIEDIVTNLKSDHINRNPTLLEVIDFKKPYIEVLRYNETEANKEEIKCLIAANKFKTARMTSPEWST